MRYFVGVDENPESETYEEERSLFRFEVTEKTVITERWNVEEGEWVDFPDMISFSGIGGDNNYKEINESEVNEIIDKLNERGVENEEEALREDEHQLEPEKEKMGRASEGSKGVVPQKIEET